MPRKTKKLIKIVDFIIFVLISINVSFAITENNKFTDSEEVVDQKVVNEFYHSTNTVTLLRWLCLIVILIMDILITVRYYLSLRLMRQKNIACNKDGLINTGLWKYLILEIFILSIFSPPYCDLTFKGRMLGGSYEYSLDSIINFLVVTKFYYGIRIYINFSIFLSEKSIMIGMRNKLVLNMKFAIKSQLKKYPYISLMLVLIFTIGIFGLMIRTFEYGYLPDEMVEGGKPQLNPNFSAYLDSFWLVVITMMTVGFGDLYPQTHIGRIIAFLSCIVGMFTVSMLIVSLSSMFEFKPEENKALSLIKVKEMRDQLKVSAADVVKTISNMYLFKHNFRANKNHLSRRHSLSKNDKKITFYLTELFILRSMHVKFQNILKLSHTISLPSDDILQNLKNKLTEDVKIFNKQKGNLVYIKDLTMKIIKEEEEIFQGMKNIKFMQDSISNFLVKFNNKMNKK